MSKTTKEEVLNNHEVQKKLEWNKGYAAGLKDCRLIVLAHLPSDEKIRDTAFEADAPTDEMGFPIYNWAYDQEQAEAFQEGAKSVRDRLLQLLESDCGDSES